MAKNMYTVAGAGPCNEELALRIQAGDKNAAERLVSQNEGYLTELARAYTPWCEMEDMKQEYKLVTDYLVDIQRIEELPVNLAVDIIDTAKEIERLDGNRSKYQQSENLLTTEQYRTMQRLEDDIPDTIKNLNDMEMRDSMLKNDMGYLEGE